jgi:hypothetical protein
MCAMLPTASSTYPEQRAGKADPTQLPWRVRPDAALCDKTFRSGERAGARTALAGAGVNRGRGGSRCLAAQLSG